MSRAIGGRGTYKMPTVAEPRIERPADPDSGRFAAEIRVALERVRLDAAQHVIQAHGLPQYARVQPWSGRPTDQHAEVRRVARQYVPTGFAWIDGRARPCTGVRHPCIGYVDADGRR